MFKSSDVIRCFGSSCFSRIELSIVYDSMTSLYSCRDHFCLVPFGGTLMLVFRRSLGAAGSSWKSCNTLVSGEFGPVADQ